MKTPFDTVAAASPEQREVLASPLRLEILGHFVASEPLSARQLARRTGRPQSSLYYHLHRLVEVGLLRPAGERPRGNRSEALYEAATAAVRLAPDGTPAARDAILRAMAAGFRMAERDLAEALERASGDTPAGLGDGAFATRLHFSATPEALEEIAGHLKAALEVITRLAAAPPDDAGRHHSLTLALLPLRGRREESSP